MPKILVIDDDDIVRETIVEILKDGGYKVVSAEDGKRGMIAFRDEHPDLVVTDIIMPQQGGIQTISEIRHVRPDAKIIAVSGGGRASSNDLLHVARQIGAADTIAKPFDPDELLSLVKACLGRVANAASPDRDKPL
jgi:two-component system, chemotaxis family, chemotaxis protein CheY